MTNLNTESRFSMPLLWKSKRTAPRNYNLFYLSFLNYLMTLTCVFLESRKLHGVWSEFQNVGTFFGQISLFYRTSSFRLSEVGEWIKKKLSRTSIFKSYLTDVLVDEVALSKSDQVTLKSVENSIRSEFSGQATDTKFSELLELAAQNAVSKVG